MPTIRNKIANRYTQPEGHALREALAQIEESEDAPWTYSVLPIPYSPAMKTGIFEGVQFRHPDGSLLDRGYVVAAFDEDMDFVGFL